MPNGDIIQIKQDSLTDRNDHTEIDRVFIDSGCVIRHFANLDCQVLYPSGEVANFKRDEMCWTVTNEKGFRRQFKDGVYSQLSRINTMSQTDQASGIITQVREDNVVRILYPEGNRYCQHADGTQIFETVDGHQTRIEKEGFAPVMYQSTEKGEDSEEWLEMDEIKSVDGMQTIVYLPDGSDIRSVKFYKASDNK